MADDPEAMDLLAGYLAQALMTYTLCYAPQKIIIGGGVADHTPIVPLARKKCAEMLNGYIVTPEVNDIDSYIVNNSLEGKQGIMGCLALGAQRFSSRRTHRAWRARQIQPTERRHHASYNPSNKKGRLGSNVRPRRLFWRTSATVRDIGAQRPLPLHSSRSSHR